MADFSYLSDTDDSVVEELIQQTQDLCALEQLSKINCSSFTHSDLPGDLESRFSKLKSFPATKCKSSSNSVFDGNSNDGSVNKKSLNTKHASFKGFKECPDGKDLKFNGNDGVLEVKSKNGYESFCDSDDGFDEKKLELKKSSAEKKNVEVKTKFGSERFSGFSDVKGGDSSSVSSMENDGLSGSKRRSVRKGGRSGSDSPSPPKRTGCFWWSPKKSSSGKKNGDFLKEHEKILKKAMKEQERINKEMEKYAKLAKQASARIILNGIDEVLSDSDGR